MDKIWRSELRSGFFGLLAFAGLGALFGIVEHSVLIFLSAYLIKNLVYLRRLYIWLEKGASGVKPEGVAVWGEIYDQVYRIKRRHKRSKKHLAKMVKNFRTATEALPDAAIVLGHGDEIEWFNSAANRILGITKADIGLPVTNLLRNPILTAYVQKGQYGDPLTLSSPQDGNTVIEVRIVPYAGGLRLLSAHDITRLKQMERTRQDFIANVSHELRTPLTVVKGYLETLVDGGDALPPEYQKSLAKMDEQTTRMQYLVNDLLLLTRLESGLSPAKNDIVAVPELLKNICDESKEVDGNIPSLTLSIESESQLNGDEQELRSAFSNLVFNAIKYTPPDGEISIRWVDSDSGVQLDVKDSGEGIEAKHLPRLTERFYRVNVANSRQKGGTGLGLAIVKHVLSRHDAELSISSTPGKGSLFSCCFPTKRIAPG